VVGELAEHLEQELGGGAALGAEEPGPEQGGLLAALAVGQAVERRGVEEAEQGRLGVGGAQGREQDELVDAGHRCDTAARWKAFFRGSLPGLFQACCPPGRICRRQPVGSQRWAGWLGWAVPSYLVLGDWVRPLDQ